MLNKENNFAFIDSQNLNLGIRSLGWRLDYRRFRIYLREKYGVEKAYCFIGFAPTNQQLYTFLQSVGFILMLKPTIPGDDGKLKGNVDADLVLQAMSDWNNFDKAVLVTSDGDFYSLVDRLYLNNKLKVVLSPHWQTCSALLKDTAREKLIYLNNLQKKLEYIKKHRLRTEP